MENPILKITSISLLLFLLVGAGCKKDEIEYADENIEISSYPGFSIYKTNNDYFNFVSLQVLSDGRLNAIPGYTLNDSRIKVDERGKITPNFRWRLKNGYILDTDTGLNEVFTDITLQEYVDYNTAHGVACMPDDLIRPRIIDQNPFTEFYSLGGLNKPPKTYTIGEINEMIESGTLETIFTKKK